MSEQWLPFAVKMPLAIDHARDPDIISDGSVFHIAVSEERSLLPSYQRRKDGIESTGYILRDGEIQQYRPLNVECDAQLAGNSWFEGGKRHGLNSWESQGMGPGEWTPEQMASIQRIIAWQHENQGTPLRINPGPNSAGFGYHRLFKSWNPNGHSCPGDDRVKQFHNVIIPWMNEGGDMGLSADDKAWIQGELDKRLNDVVVDGTETLWLATAVTRILRVVRRIESNTKTPKA